MGKRVNLPHINQITPNLASMGLLYYWIYQSLAHSIASKQTRDNSCVRNPITDPWESMIHPNAPLEEKEPSLFQGLNVARQQQRQRSILLGKDMERFIVQSLLIT